MVIRNTYAPAVLLIQFGKEVGENISVCVPWNFKGVEVYRLKAKPYGVCPHKAIRFCKWQVQIPGGGKTKCFACTCFVCLQIGNWSAYGLCTKLVLDQHTVEEQPAWIQCWTEIGQESSDLLQYSFKYSCKIWFFSTNTRHYLFPIRID
jgi:hypothetical protein